MDKDYLKEAIRTQMDYLKLLALFIIGLVTGDVSLILKISFSPQQNIIEPFLLILGILLLIAFLIASSIIIFSIQKNLKILKK